MNAADKATKLLALARDPAATPSEAATARRLANDICNKFGVQPSATLSSSGSSARALTGQVSPSWRQPEPQPWQPANKFFRSVPDKNLSGITVEDARRMALEILNATQTGSWRLEQDEEYLCQQAFDGLLTDFGKVLLMGLHAVVVS